MLLSPRRDSFFVFQNSKIEGFFGRLFIISLCWLLGFGLKKKAVSGPSLNCNISEIINN
jgi:hypothetical protein